MGFGTPKFGNDGGWNRYKLKVPANKGETTSLVLRILPPYGNQQDTGRWSLYFSVHFGFEGRDQRDATKTSARPFLCVEDKDMRSGMTRATCPMCEHIAMHKERLKRKEAELVAAGKTKEEVKLLTKDLNDWLRKYNIDRKHYMAVMDEQGKFGILTISHTLKKKLEARITELHKDQNINALDLSTGVWFRFTRQGIGLETEDDVHAVTETFRENGKTFTSVKMAPLTDQQIDTALEVLPSLETMVTRISRDQVARLTECSGDPEEVDHIFNANSLSSNRTSSSSGRTSSHKTEAPPPATPPPATSSAADDDEAALMRRLEAIRAAKEAKAKVAAAPPVSKPTPPADTADMDFESMDDEAFLAAFPDPSKAV